jgi:hypothetical protein
VGCQRVFFRAARQQPAGHRAGKRRLEGQGRWNSQHRQHCQLGAIYATLIANGHQRGDLGTYTERQLKLFYRQALQLERQRSAMRLMDVNAGMAGGDAAKDRMNELRK